MSTARPYHHGDLRRVLLEAAVEAIGQMGPAAVSLRDLARRAGVSHAAPAYHFGDKAGLLTAIAADGFERLGAALREAYARTGSFLEVGVAYVRFAVTHRAHFEVMFRPELYRPDDPEVSRARAASAALLYGPVAGGSGGLKSEAPATAPGGQAMPSGSPPVDHGSGGLKSEAPATAPGGQAMPGGSPPVDHGSEPGPEQMRAAVAAWSLTHGLATLWLNHNLPRQLGDDPEQITREVARYLSPNPPAP